jgi:hypothetical protein
MKISPPMRAWFALGVLLPAALATARSVVPDSPLYASPAPAHALLALTCVGKAGSLLIASIVSLANARSFDRDNPVRRAWILLALAFGAFFLGQASYAPYQIVQGVEAPFPSVADVFWLAGYPLVVVALAAFGVLYADAGLYLGSARQRRLIVAFAILACAVVGYPLLLPIVRTPAPPLTKAINLAYPLLDLAIMVASAVLVRTTLPLRQGRVGRTWMWMLGGFVAACAGDVAFSYVSQLKIARLWPLVDVMLLVSYGAMARAALSQRSLGATEEDAQDAA